MAIRLKYYEIPKYNIVNVVSSSKTKSKIDIEKLSLLLPHVIYEPESFPALIYRPPSYNATVIMFASGKITSTGTNSVKKSFESITSTIFEINQKLGTNLKLNKITIENIVALTNLQQKVDLAKFARLNDCKYQPEIFPGLTISVFNNTKANVFSTGKIVLLGSKNIKDLKISNEKISRMILDSK